MALKDFKEFGKEQLVLPCNGVSYAIPTPTLSVGLKITKIMSEDGAKEMSTEDQWALVLGPAFDKMVENDVPIEFVSRAFLVALADFNYGRDMAIATWEVGTDPEALAAWVTARQNQAESTSTDEENTTP